MSARAMRPPLEALASAALLFALAWCAALPPTGRAQTAAGGAPAAAGPLWSIQLEPGFRLGSGRLLVPMIALSEDLRPLPPPPRERLSCRLDGQPAEAIELTERVPMAVLVISDQFLAQPIWASTTILAPASPHWLGLWDASQEPIRHLPPQPAAQLPLPESMPAPHVPRIWDAILAGIRELAVLPQAPQRRVILVISDLREEEASLHPMAACLEAAQSLRIAIHAVVIEGAPPPAAERLLHLAENSGGSLGVAVSALPALTSGLARIEAARGLILPDPGAPLPLSVIVSVEGAAPPVLTTVGERPRGRYAPGSGLVAAGVVLVITAAGWLGWRQWRRRPIGYLLSVEESGARRWAVPAAGLTIGRTGDNGLALAEKSVSKHHALVRWRRGQVQLIDLRSTNGTQVGGRWVRTAALNDGDIITFGNTVRLQFRRRAQLAGDSRRRADGTVA